MARANALYYASHDPFADFTTSPEISQVFGEIVGLWCAQAWRALGSPAPVSLIEAGPGRGTLMADALRAVRRAAPDFAASLKVHLIEASPRLRMVQAARLPGAALGAAWHDALETVPQGPFLLVANEFLDALPIRQFVRRGDGWKERYVADLKWAERSVDAVEVPARHDLPEGGIVEVNEPARAFVASVAVRLVRSAGVALFFDYGPMRSTGGDSLQALANKQPADPLSFPGTADLTAHVDFEDLANIARHAGAAIDGPVTQGSFLKSLGLLERTERLLRSRPDQAASLERAASRLTDPKEMGELFKVMALRPKDCGRLPGFGT